MYRLTAKQSKTARSLLKWNLHDLASRAKGLQPKRIDSFEHGLVHLIAWENDELVEVFKKAGIVFKADLEVVLQNARHKPEHQGGGTRGEGAYIVIDAEELLRQAGEADKTPTDQPGSPEEEERKKKRHETGH